MNAQFKLKIERAYRALSWVLLGAAIALCFFQSTSASYWQRLHSELHRVHVKVLHFDGQADARRQISTSLCAIEQQIPPVWDRNVARIVPLLCMVIGLGRLCLWMVQKRCKDDMGKKG